MEQIRVGCWESARLAHVYRPTPQRSPPREKIDTHEPSSWTESDATQHLCDNWPKQHNFAHPRPVINCCWKEKERCIECWIGIQRGACVRCVLPNRWPEFCSTLGITTCCHLLCTQHWNPWQIIPKHLSQPWLSLLGTHTTSHIIDATCNWTSWLFPYLLATTIATKQSILDRTFLWQISLCWHKKNTLTK
jgi:hypothetical protein